MWSVWISIFTEIQFNEKHANTYRNCILIKYVVHHLLIILSWLNICEFTQGTSSFHVKCVSIFIEFQFKNNIYRYIQELNYFPGKCVDKNLHRIPHRKNTSSLSKRGTIFLLSVWISVFTEVDIKKSNVDIHMRETIDKTWKFSKLSLFQIIQVIIHIRLLSLKLCVSIFPHNHIQKATYKYLCEKDYFCIAPGSYCLFKIISSKLFGNIYMKETTSLPHDLFSIFTEFWRKTTVKHLIKGLPAIIKWAFSLSQNACKNIDIHRLERNIDIMPIKLYTLLIILVYIFLCLFFTIFFFDLILMYIYFHSWFETMKQGEK